MFCLHLFWCAYTLKQNILDIDWVLHRHLSIHTELNYQLARKSVHQVLHIVMSRKQLEQNPVKAKCTSQKTEYRSFTLPYILISIIPIKKHEMCAWQHLQNLPVWFCYIKKKFLLREGKRICKYWKIRCKCFIMKSQYNCSTCQRFPYEFAQIIKTYIYPSIWNTLLFVVVVTSGKSIKYMENCVLDATLHFG